MIPIKQSPCVARASAAGGQPGRSHSDQRGFLSTLATAGVFVVVLFAAVICIQTAAAADNAIRPFRVNIPDAALVDLRQRVLATRWPDRETVTDQSQGVQLAQLHALVRYWGTDYDCR